MKNRFNFSFIPRYSIGLISKIIAVKPNSANSGSNFFNKNETHGTYGALLLDPNWKRRRLDILRRDSYQCVNCNSVDKLQVHHRQYHFSKGENKFRLPWEYPSHLMVTLCEKCHSKGHYTFKIPTKYY